MYKRVRVLREQFSHRSDEVNKLSFKIKVKAVNISWLHIGKGSLKLRISGVTRLRNIKKLNLWGLTKAINEGSLIVTYDYYECVRYGNKIVIPGSSLKGVCRSRIELLQKADIKGDVGSCFIKASQPVTKAPQKGMSGWRHYKIWNAVLGEGRGKECQATRWEYYEDIQVCKTCDVFGTSGLTSKVFFGNLTSNNAGTAEVTLDFNEKAEIVKPKANFEGEIVFTSCNLSDIGLVFIGLNLHSENKPILIGKNKYRKRLVVEGPPQIKGKEIEFGIINLNITKIIIPPRFKNYLKEVIGDYEFNEDEYGFIILNGEYVKAFVNKAVNEALTKVPWIKAGLEINEFEILKSKGVMK